MEVDPDSDAEHFRKFIYEEIIQIIHDSIMAREMTAYEARDIARQLLEVMPEGQTIEEIYASALRLSATFTQLMPLILPVVREYKSRYRST